MPKKPVKCPSPQDVLTAAILRQKWIDSVSAKLIATFETLQTKPNFSKATKEVQAFMTEMTSAGALRRHHFKGRGSMLRALEEALVRAYGAANDDPTLFERLAQMARAAASA